MPYTSDEVAALPAGAPVTLTYQPVDGPSRTWHMQAAGHPMVVVFNNPRTLMTCGQDTTEPGATRWNKFEPFWSHSDAWRAGSEWLSDGDALLSRGCLTIRGQATGWTISPINAEGQARKDETEPVRRRYERLLEQVRALDPALAESLDDTIDALTSQSREDGADGRLYFD